MGGLQEGRASDVWVLCGGLEYTSIGCTSSAIMRPIGDPGQSALRPASLLPVPYVTDGGVDDRRF